MNNRVGSHEEYLKRMREIKEATVNVEIRKVVDQYDEIYDRHRIEHSDRAYYFFGKLQDQNDLRSLNPEIEREMFINYADTIPEFHWLVCQQAEEVDSPVIMEMRKLLDKRREEIDKIEAVR